MFNFLDNISAADKVSRHTSRQGGFIKLALVILENLIFIPSLEEKEVDFFCICTISGVKCRNV